MKDIKVMLIFLWKVGGKKNKCFYY